MPSNMGSLKLPTVKGRESRSGHSGHSGRSGVSMSSSEDGASKRYAYTQLDLLAHSFHMRFPGTQCPRHPEKGRGSCPPHLRQWG